MKARTHGDTVDYKRLMEAMDTGSREAWVAAFAAIRRMLAGEPEAIDGLNGEELALAGPGAPVAPMATACMSPEDALRFLLAGLDMGRMPAGGPPRGSVLPRGCGSPRTILIVNLQFPLLAVRAVGWTRNDTKTSSPTEQAVRR